MAKLTDWKSTHSDGTLPLESDASEFQYRYAIIWDFAIDYLLADQVGAAVGAIGGLTGFLGQSIGSKDLTGDWRIQIINSDEAVLFEQTVTLTVNEVSLASVAFGALTLGLFTWAFKKQEIVTTIIGGEPINSGNPAWKHTIGGTQFSEFGTMERGGGSDFTDAGGTVSDYWDSPVYLMNVPVGSKLVIQHAGAQGGRVPRNLLFQFRFDEAGRLSLWLDRQNAVRAAVPVATNVFAEHTYGPVADRFRRSSIRAAGPVVWKDPTNRYWILALATGGDWGLWWDDLDGRDLKPLTYTKENTATLSPSPTIGAPVVVWTKNFRNPDGAPRAQHGSYQIAQLGGNIYFKWSADNVSYSPAQVVGEHDDKPCRILVERTAGGRDVLRVTDFGDVDFESTNGGDDWAPIEAK